MLHPDFACISETNYFPDMQLCSMIWNCCKMLTLKFGICRDVGRWGLKLLKSKLYSKTSKKYAFTTYMCKHHKIKKIWSLLSSFSPDILKWHRKLQSIFPIVFNYCGHEKQFENRGSFWRFENLHYLLIAHMRIRVNTCMHKSTHVRMHTNSLAHTHTVPCVF